MAAEVVLGRVCIGTRHELGYVQFKGQQHLCLFGLQLLLDTSLGRRISALAREGDLYLDKVFFFRSSLFFLEPHFFLGAWSLVLFSFSLASPALLFPWFCSFISFSPLTYVYDMCKCGGVLRCSVRRPKYPSKSPLFLGSLDKMYFHPKLPVDSLCPCTPVSK
jgi:hypothetical protein